MGIIMPKNQITRPTLSKVRAAIFNILGNDLKGLVFWDLFAGSGAIGLSALSLGAKSVVLVEQDIAACKALKQNIEEAKKRFVKSEAVLIEPILLASELKKVWSRLSKLTPPDLIWADPPYVESLSWASFLKSELPHFVNEGTLLMMEIQSDEVKQAEQKSLLVDPQWDLVKTKQYGNCSLVIWRKT